MNTTPEQRAEEFTYLATIAQDFGYENLGEFLYDRYVVDGLGVIEIAELLFVPTNRVRKYLALYQIPIRSLGGLRYQKIVVTPELLAEVDKDGAELVALRLGVESTTLRIRIKRYHKRMQQQKGTVLDEQP